MKKALFVFAVLFILATVVRADQIDNRKALYPLKDTHTKLVDDKGRGFDALYGVRNFRAVLNGVVYRGGANNDYNKFGRRPTRNPLPTVGLQNLCAGDFGVAIYLYPTNFDSAPHVVTCGSKQLVYKQFNPTTTSGQTQIIETVYRSITRPETGAVYMHCWNGWHASGVASAIVLRQFCGMSADDAIKYWTLNTDGVPVDSTYDSLKSKIRAYRPSTKYPITEAQRKRICF